MEKKKTNKRQFAWLVAFMEKYPELARGGKFTDSRESVPTLWARAQTSLNSLGPPTRSVAQWQKVWTDKKLQLKKKLQHNSNEVRATGGGRNTQYSFTDLEEVIIRLLSLNRLVDHSGAVFGTPASPVASTSRDQPRQISCNDDCQSDEGEPTRNEPSCQPEEVSARENGGERGDQPTPLRRRVNKRNYRKTLLEKQTKDLGKMKAYVQRPFVRCKPARCNVFWLQVR
ncbi:uncharacterized protein LOC134284944 [Aedes albopictus]|uniref:Regulatory protein zeste n=1 Tax=Aedes albopictus TaxID=7160 RepID=A0ABM1YTN4_AEDAL